VAEMQATARRLYPLAAAIAMTSGEATVAEMWATARRLSLLAVAMQAIDGSTTQHIVAELRIGIGRPRTSLEARPAVTLLPIARLAPGNRWADKVAIWPATAPEELARAIGPEERVVATGPVEAEGIASEAGISPVAAVGTGMPSGAVPGDTTDRTLAPVAAVAPPAWDREAGEVSVVVAAVGAADRARKLRDRNRWEHRMKPKSTNEDFSGLVWLVGAMLLACLCTSVLSIAQQSSAKKAPAATAAPAGALSFDTPQQAADVLIDAAEKFDEGALIQIFGPGGEDIVFSGEVPLDRQHAANFVSEAHEKKSVSVDPKTGTRAFLLVGNEDWPFPVPIVKKGEKWFFDAKAGRQELLYRRIGTNELDAIQICHGYVEAQYDYAFQSREGYDVNQYAQRIISTPGKQDGLAWQNADGTWGGPVGDRIARAIEQGYTSEAEPYHGYFFKILKGQGPAAVFGEMDFVVKGVMIGGFALVAAPAEYGVTGVQTFMVSDDGVVYQKDFGPKTIDEFKKMERFNPDKSWTPVSEEYE